MSTRADFIRKQAAFLRDDAAILSPEQRDEWITQAVRVYSRFRPKEKVVDIAGTGAFEVAVPSDWVEEFSAPTSLEYPLGDQDPTFIPLEDVRLYRTPLALKLRLVRGVFATGQSARLIYTVPHTVSATASTVPVTDEDAVAALAASLGCEALAAYYAQTSDPTITADAVNYRTKSGEYAARAKQLRGIFRESLGIKEDDIAAPASATRDWSTTYQWGEDRILHPKDRR